MNIIKQISKKNYYFLQKFNAITTVKNKIGNKNNSKNCHFTNIKKTTDKFSEQDFFAE